MLKFLPGIYFGWGLGANDAANVFGPQTYSGIITWRRAAVLTSIFVVAGALLEGQSGFEQIGGIAGNMAVAAVISTLSAAIMIHIMSYLKIPASTSHGIVGALVGTGWAFSQPVNMGNVLKSVICWVITPFGAAAVAFVLFHFLNFVWAKRIKNIKVLNQSIKIASIVIGCYGAYSLGANNLANIVGPYVGAGMIAKFPAQILGGVAIALGVMTYSKNVMSTVGSGITVLSPFSALVAILSNAIVLHFFTLLGVPVSASQGVVGAVFGVGVTKGLKTVSYKKLIQILGGWIVTLGGAALFSASLAMLYKKFF